jgi:hypothetical protein
MRWRYVAVFMLLLGACAQPKPLTLYLYGVSSSGTHYHFSFSEQSLDSGNETHCQLVTDDPKTKLDCQDPEMTHPYQEITEFSFAVVGTLEGHPFGQNQSVRFHYTKNEPAGPYQLATGDLALLPRLLCVVATEDGLPTQDADKAACQPPGAAAPKP